MESKTITVCILVVVLGIAATAAGFAAEATRVKNPTIRVFYVGLAHGPEVECTYPSSPAMGLAIAATVALVVACVIITSATDGFCSCCKTIPHVSRFARFCIVISWIMSSVAVILFVAGEKLSSRKMVKEDVDGNYYCYIVRPGIFSAAAIMSLLSVVFALVYYLNYVSATNGMPEVELEVEAPTITDDKKAPIADAKNEKPKKPSQKI